MTLAYAEHAVGVPDATGIRAPPNPRADLIAF